MAGSLSHITADDGKFRHDLVRGSDRDQYEALEECHQIIAALLDEVAVGNEARTAFLRKTCEGLSYPVPRAAPALEPKRWGAEAREAYFRDHPEERS